MLFISNRHHCVTAVRSGILLLPLTGKSGFLQAKELMAKQGWPSFLAILLLMNYGRGSSALLLGGFNIFNDFWSDAILKHRWVRQRIDSLRVFVVQCQQIR